METLVVVGVRGLGREIALHFARLGWQVVCVARTGETVENLARAVDEAGGRGVPLVADLLDAQSLAPLRDRAIDLCVAAQTAGGRFGPRPLLELDGEELDRSLAAYLRGTWNLLHAVGPGMIANKRGTFLQMGTTSGMRAAANWAVLGAVQHGLRALVQVAAREWKPQGVHVAYLPIDGPIESERTKAFADRIGPDKIIPPQEIARACEYLHRQDPRAWTHELVLRPAAGEWSAPT